MPAAGKRWFHVIFNTHCTWLPGDPRGFRSRKHRIHSSGDYKQPPPVGEHSGLHEYVRAAAGVPLTLSPNLRAVIGRAIREKVGVMGIGILAGAVSGQHVHLLVELPGAIGEAKKAVGQIKQRASYAVREELPGKVWADGCGLRRIKDQEHQNNTYRYILTKQSSGTWTWSFKDGEGWM